MRWRLAKSGDDDGRRVRESGFRSNNGQAAPRPMHLVYARERQPTPKLTTFIDFLLQRYGPAATPPPATLT